MPARFLPVLLLAVSLPVSLGCRCMRPDFAAAAEDDAAPLTSAIVVRQTVVGGKYLYKLALTADASACKSYPLLRYVYATSRIGGSVCGVGLTRGMTYMLPLNADLKARTMLDSCRVIEPISALNDERKKILADRNRDC